jgi:hypothetical protein
MERRVSKSKVSVKVDGARLRYRDGYFADPEKAGSELRAKAAIQEAALSPVEATSLGMIVSGKLSGPVAERKVELHVGLDPKQLVLQNTENHEKGAVDLYFVQRDSKGELLAAENQRVGISLEEMQYEYLSKAGMVLGRHLTIAPGAEELRVLVRDASSEALGSVTIPVQALFAGPGTAGTVAPAKLQSPN